MVGLSSSLWSDADGKLIEGTPTGEPSLAGLRGVVSTRGSECRQVLATGFRARCHKCQIHLLPPCWARCHIPLGYGTGTSYEKNFKPVLTPRGSEGRLGWVTGWGVTVCHGLADIFTNTSTQQTTPIACCRDKETHEHTN